MGATPKPVDPTTEPPAGKVFPTSSPDVVATAPEVPGGDEQVRLTDEELEALAEAKRVQRISDAKAELEPPTVQGKDDAPVYDERGNVRPRGTKGARPMTYAERVKIAQKLGAGKG